MTLGEFLPLPPRVWLTHSPTARTKRKYRTSTAMSPGSRFLWGKASRGSDWVGWGLLELLSMVLSKCSILWEVQMPVRCQNQSAFLTRSTAASSEHPDKRTTMEGCVWGHVPQEGRATYPSVCPSAHSFIQQIQWSHFKSPADSLAIQPIGKILKRINSVSSTDGFPLQECE